jgi:cytoskeletal protein RodZ
MKTFTYLTIAGLSALTFCCNKTQAERSEEKALDEAHERQEEALERKQERQEMSLEERQKAEAKALERAHEVEEKKLEQNQQALQPAAVASLAPSAATGLTAEAVAQLSAARCAREARCGNIGADKSYSNQTQCESKLSADMKEELNGYECPKGIVLKEFSECLQAIRTEECGSPLDTLARVVACSESDICAD